MKIINHFAALVAAILTFAAAGVSPAHACGAGVCAQGFDTLVGGTGRPLARPWGPGTQFIDYNAYTRAHGLAHMSAGGRIRLINGEMGIDMTKVRGTITINGAPITYIDSSDGPGGYYTGYYSGSPNHYRIQAQAPNFIPGSLNAPNVSSQCSGSHHEGC